MSSERFLLSLGPTENGLKPNLCLSAHLWVAAIDSIYPGLYVEPGGRKQAPIHLRA